VKEQNFPSFTAAAAAAAGKYFFCRSLRVRRKQERKKKKGKEMGSYIILSLYSFFSQCAPAELALFSKL
jgi:hypothetical protein